MSSCSLPAALPSRSSIWQQKRQQLIDRLAAKGIHICEDDPRLAEPSPSDSPEAGSALDRSSDDPGKAPFTQRESAVLSDDRPERHRHHSVAVPSPPGESLLIGSDPAAERARRRQLQEATRQQLQEQILEKQRRLEVERIQHRMQILSKAREAQRPLIQNDDAARPTTPGDVSTSFASISMVGSDPDAERKRRKQMQAEMNRILQEQMHERAIVEGRTPASSAASDVPSPFASPWRQRLRSPEPDSAGQTPVSLSALDRDPEQEMARRRQSQTDLNNYLRNQIQERQRRRSSEQSTPMQAPPFHADRRSAPERHGETAACSPVARRGVGSLLFAGEAESPGTIRRRKREYGQALQHQMMQSPLNRHRLDFSRQSWPTTSGGVGSLMFPERSESPQSLRRKKSEYALALRNQMQERTSPDRHGDTDANRYQGAIRESRSVVPSGEKVLTPEILRQKQRDYAEALQLQMQERRQRRFREEAERETADEWPKSMESPHPQTVTASLPDLSTSDSKTLQSRLRKSEENLSPRLASQSPGSLSASSIFNYDPVKIAIDQKIQRKQLGEALQKQMDEQRRRKEESRIKEQRENQEDHQRILRQLEEMNRSHSSSNLILNKDQSNSETVDEGYMKPIEEQGTKEIHSSANECSREIRAPREYVRDLSPATDGSSLSTVDWDQAEAQMIRPLRELRNKLSLGSEELRQRIAQQRQAIQLSKAKALSELDEHTPSLTNSSSWLPVEPESERQLPVLSEFVQVPTVSSDQCLNSSDEDALERFVNESESQFSRPSSSSSKRRSLWGTPAFPSAMPSIEGQNFNPNKL